MGFSTVTVTHSFVNANGTPASGAVAFFLTDRMTNASVTVMPAAPLQATLDGNGNLSQLLLANDDAATTPQGVSWHTVVNVAGADEVSFDINVPSAAAGRTVDLGTLLPQNQTV